MRKVRQQLVGRFVELGATAPDRAIPFDATDRQTARLLRRMRRYGAVAEARPGYYWLDPDRLGTFRNAVRRRVAAWVGASSVAVAAATAMALAE